ncbi:MAG: ABC transporter substrate-binding protein [Desulfobacterales bacterium]|nr:ABC transporter substrate-binding protein [Desulfobacterales bacterium]MDJ0885607.1 ABC transporter substrate-binding protein [Desulfobacterales bacterium]
MLLLAVAFTSPANAGEKLSLMLDWFPNVDHLPIYVAQEKGYFREAGIEVEILSPSDTSDALKLAVAGQVDLAVSYQPQTIIAAAEGLDVRVVGRLVEHPLTTLLFLKEKGFKAPSELSGRTIGYTVPGLMDVLMQAFARINGIANVRLVNVGFTIVPALTSGQVDAVMGPFKTYETVTMAAKGIEAGYFELENWGIPDYDELIFICGTQTLANKPAAVRAFAQAVARGIAFQQEDAEAALGLYFQALPDADREIETAAYKLTRPYFAGSQTLEAARWETFAAFALEHGLIPRAVDVKPLLTNW